MSLSKVIILLGLTLLMAVPVSLVQAQQDAIEGSGTAIVSDAQFASDRITYSLTDVSSPGPSSTFEGWLISDDGSRVISTGVMKRSSRGRIKHAFISEEGDNFISEFSGIRITIEPIPDPDPNNPSGLVAFSHTVPLSAMTHIRHLLVSWPEDSSTGILTDLNGQLDAAIQHADLARNSSTITDLRKHVHHVINIIEGSDGPNFDASFGNPGDGKGVLAHATDRQHAGFATSQSQDFVVADHGENVEDFGANAESWALEARDQALDILGQDSLKIASTLLTFVSGRLDAARNGISATGQGGSEQAYTEAQSMAGYSFGIVTTTGGSRRILPGVGDLAVPWLAQTALIASFALFAAGGFLLYRERCARKSRL